MELFKSYMQLSEGPKENKVEHLLLREKTAVDVYLHAEKINRLTWANILIEQPSAASLTLCLTGTKATETNKSKAQIGLYEVQQ